MQFTFDMNGVVTYDFKVNTSASGSELRETLLELQNMNGSVNNAVDVLSYQMDRAKLIMELVDDQVKDVSNGSLSRKKTVSSMFNIEIGTSYGKYSPLKAREEYIVAKAKYNAAKLALSALNNAIDTVRSALSWDRAEFLNA